MVVRMFETKIKTGVKTLSENRRLENKDVKIVLNFSSKRKQTFPKRLCRSYLGDFCTKWQQLNTSSR